MWRRRLTEALSRWLPIAIAILGVGGAAYVSIQQVHRSMADDPQIEWAEDAAARLAAGGSATSYDAAEKVDVARSLAPWLAVYDDAGRPLASSGILDGRPPQLPAGVLDAARSRGRHRVTWQPRPGVRVATAICRVPGGTPGFVVAGRSLREAEARVDNLGRIAVAGLLVTWFATFAACLTAALLRD